MKRLWSVKKNVVFMKIKNFVICRLKMLLSFSKFLQPNFPHKSVLSLSNAIVGASVLSMGYCFQQVIININK